MIKYYEYKGEFTMKGIRNLINLMFINLVDEKNFKSRKIVYYVAMVLSIIAIILSFFAPMCILEVKGEIVKITAINWIWIDKTNNSVNSFLLAQILSFMILTSALVVSLVFFFLTGREKNEDKINRNSVIISNIGFIVISLYLIFTWFFPILSYSIGNHKQFVNMNIFLSIYIVLLKVLYIIFFDKLNKFKNAEIIRLDDNTVKVIIEKKFKARGKNNLEGFSNVEPSSTEFKPIEVDNCPIFTELDSKKEKYEIEIKERKKSTFANPTLPLIVDFIVRYARDSRLHLYYTHEEIATFIAGLGTTNLSILQGMSGTGKTSLPKIVSEALYSNCDIIEVESSWRDKNELLGYYNEFSKIYTPKKFTQALYKSKLNSEVITFIVLDEMNLSRIEYYFSDFLSLMENEPEKREIRLVNVKLNKNGSSKSSYKGLIDGHTIKIPNNIWFIGTANRDESTYDISDKVYDRANTMNFDKRAKKAEFFGEELKPQYVSNQTLLELFDKAKKEVEFTIDNNPIVEEVEKILEPYNISFGNRIALQIETFVKIYSSCFEIKEEATKDALEIILLSKVVRKLELKNIEDKEELASKFENLKLFRCSNFIKNLKED